MTEAEWLGSNWLQPMLDCLRDKASERKLRLFACAVCRRLWHHLPDERSRFAVEVAEQFADGDLSGAEIASAFNLAWAAFDELRQLLRDSDTPASFYAAFAACEAAWEPATWRAGPYDTVRDVLNWSAKASWAEVCGPDTRSWDFERYGSRVWAEFTVRSTLMKDVFYNPFRSLPTLAASWLTPVVRSLAQTAYEDRQLPSGHLDPLRLAVLADALEEAGCGDVELLGHLRCPGPHVRGCFAVDAVLGRT